MKLMKKVATAALFATTAAVGAVAGSTDAKADHHNYFYSYETEYGYIQFYNYDNHWPVIKRIRFDNYWYRCSFWSNRYSCERERRGGYGGGHGGGY